MPVEPYQSVEALGERLKLVDEMIQGTDLKTKGRKFSAEEREVWDDLHAEREELVSTIDERRVRERQLRLAANSRDPAAVTPAWEAPHGERPDEAGPGSPHVVADRALALRAIDRHQGLLSPEAGDNLESLVRHRDPTGIDSRYIAAVADASYASAFSKMLRYPRTLTCASARRRPQPSDG